MKTILNLFGVKLLVKVFVLKKIKQKRIKKALSNKTMTHNCQTILKKNE